MSSQPRGPNRFTQREVSRAPRAVRDSKTPVKSVEIDPRSGKITVMVGAARDDGTESKVTNPFDTAPLPDAPRPRKTRK